MAVTKILVDEHEAILTVIAALEKMAARAENDTRLDGGRASQAVEFIREFADRAHHGKEEKLLFDAMVRAGIPREGGPIGVMLADHDAGRAHVRGMAGAIDRAAAGERDAVTEFVTHARGFIELLRGHIWKEDNILYSIAEQAVSDEEKKALGVAFDALEREHVDSGLHDKYMRVARDLADHYGISWPAPNPFQGSGSICH